MSKKLMARREFLKTTTTGLGAFFFLSSNDPKSPGRTDISSKGERTYTYRTLGKTGIKLPVITMGVMNSDNPNLVRAALDAGLVMLDTAQVYQRGTNEGMIGEVLKGRPGIPTSSPPRVCCLKIKIQACTRQKPRRKPFKRK